MDEEGIEKTRKRKIDMNVKRKIRKHEKKYNGQKTRKKGSMEEKK